MKFLADVNIENLIVKHLRELSYDVKWMLEENPFLNDEDILLISINEKRILLTNDKDFGELIFKKNKNMFGVILFRIQQNEIELKVKIIDSLIKSHKDKLEFKFIVVSKNKIRFVNI